MLAYVEERTGEIDRGPSEVFAVMSNGQRLAMHELFEARSFLRREGVSVD